MAGLNKAELYKEGREWRVELFIKKFKEGSEFETTDGQKKILIYDENIEKLLKNRQNINGIRLKTTDGSDILFSKLQKTAEFGGGKGSGGGAHATRTNESAQAVYLGAYYTRYGSCEKTSIDITPAELIEEYSKGYTNGNITDILNIDESWIDSSEAIAIKFYSDVGGNKLYMFVRHDEFVNVLNNKFKFLNMQIGKYFGNINKWNASDIWAIEQSFYATAIKKINEAESLSQLNALIYGWLYDKTVIGISLKKASKSGVRVQYFNFDGRSDLLEDAQFKHFASSTNGFFSSKDMYLNFAGGSIQYHNFGATTIQGQITGKTGFGGKVGHSACAKILQNIGVKNNTNDVNKKYYFKYAEALKIIGGDKTKQPYIDFMKMMYQEYIKWDTNKKFNTLEKFMNEIKTKDDRWILSKCVTIQLINNIESVNGAQQFLYDSLSYAGSETKHSSAFVKMYG